MEERITKGKKSGVAEKKDEQSKLFWLMGL